MNFESIKKYYLDNRLKCNCIALAILFLINCFVAYFSIVAFVLTAILILFENKQNGLSLCVFCIPFCAIDNYVSAIALFVVLLVYVIKQYVIMFFFDKKKINWYVLSTMLVFFIYSIMPIGEYNLGWAVKLLIMMLLALLLNLFVNYKEIFNLKFNLNLLAIGLIISSAYFITYFVSPVIYNKPLSTVNEGFIRFSALQVNPNTLAMICEVSLGLLTIYLLQDKFEWTDIMSYVIFSVLGLSTFSKTFLILFSIMFIVMVIYCLKKYKLKALYTFLIIGIVLLMLLFLKRDIFVMYLKRFTTGVGSETDLDSYEYIVNVVTTGRYQLWLTVLDFMFTHPLVLVFGNGFGAPLIASLSAHNFYISLIYELGIVGTLLCIAMFVTILYVYFKQKQGKFYKSWIVPIVIIGMLMMVEDLFLYIY